MMAAPPANYENAGGSSGLRLQVEGARFEAFSKRERAATAEPLIELAPLTSAFPLPLPPPRHPPGFDRHHGQRSHQQAED